MNQQMKDNFIAIQKPQGGIDLIHLTTGMVDEVSPPDGSLTDQEAAQRIAELFGTQPEQEQEMATKTARTLPRRLGRSPTSRWRRSGNRRRITESSPVASTWPSVTARCRCSGASRTAAGTLTVTRSG